MARNTDSDPAIYPQTETGKDDPKDRNAKETKTASSEEKDSLDISISAGVGRRRVILPVVVRLEGGCEWEVSRVVRGKRGLEHVLEKNCSKRMKEDKLDSSEELFAANNSQSMSDSGPASSDLFTPAEGEANLQEEAETEEETVTDDEEDDYPLSDYPLVNRFPDLECDLAEPEPDYAESGDDCDLSDQLVPTTSEPDLVLYSDRTSSDSTMPDCRCVRKMQGRDTGFNLWEVED